MRYAVIGAGAIGGTVAAGLVRDGHDVVLCDADPEHVAAINAGGLRIEGPVEQHTVHAPAVTPAGLEGPLHAVLLAVKAHHTAAAVAPIAPLLAPDGFIVSLQNGFNEDVIAAAVGSDRVVGAFVNFGADVIAPGRILRGNRAAFWIGELDGADTPRVRGLVHDIADARQTANIHGFLWSKEAYGAILFATAVSDLSIADALAEPRYRPLYLALAREVLAAATADPEPFDGFDPSDLEGSIDRLVEFNRHSAKTHSGIYRDLAVRHRKTEVDAMLAALDGPLVRHTGALIHAIEDGRRVCERANLELLAAYERLERLGGPLNAVTAVIEAPARAATGPLHGRPIPIKDNIDVAGLVTTNASTVDVPPPAAADAEVVARVRAAAGDVFCKTNLLEYSAGSVNPAYGMTFNPHDRGRTAGRLVERLGGARRRGRVRPGGRHRQRRIHPRPGRLLRHRRRQADHRFGALAGTVPALAYLRRDRAARADGRRGRRAPGGAVRPAVPAGAGRGRAGGRDSPPAGRPRRAPGRARPSDRGAGGARGSGTRAVRRPHPRARGGRRRAGSHRPLGGVGGARRPLPRRGRSLRAGHARAARPGLADH